ncbi:MAG: DUF3267 domain-containing protein [Oscillospiraceae bacterium]|nr:DUF3267 domain-containing protein [Oscillospiraceae bacterium]
MKLIYKGKYESEKDLPVRNHPEGFVAFREAEDIRRLAILLNCISIPLLIAAIGGLVLRGRTFLMEQPLATSMGMIASFAILFPHELLHAICFKGEVELWTNLKMGMLFVVGTEDMSKSRFVWMSLLPNLVFGWIPYVLFLLHPQWVFLGVMGAFAIPMGIGDYYNVYNCLTQVPKGALVYLSGMHSYWYVPKKS